MYYLPTDSESTQSETLTKEESGKSHSFFTLLFSLQTLDLRSLLSLPVYPISSFKSNILGMVFESPILDVKWGKSEE